LVPGDDLVGDWKR